MKIGGVYEYNFDRSHSTCSIYLIFKLISLKILAPCAMYLRKIDYLQYLFFKDYYQKLEEGKYRKLLDTPILDEATFSEKRKFVYMYMCMYVCK